MGTSTSSAGGRAGSPLDPEWLTPAAPSSGESQGEAGDGDNSPQDGVDGEAPQRPSGDLAPARRYASARSNMGSFLSSGDREYLRAATRSLISRGMGGAGRASSTMRSSTRGAAALGQFLSDIRSPSTQRARDWIQRVRQLNLAAEDLILEVIKEVLPNSGSLDEESIRNSATDALSQIYEQHPDIDLLSLSDQQIYDVIAITLSNEICNRIDQQLGQTYEKLKHDPALVQLRRNDICEFIKAEVGIVMEENVQNGWDLNRLSNEVLQAVLEVFAT